MVADTCNATRYGGYNKDLIDRFCSMGFDVDRVVETFEAVGLDQRGGADYQLGDARVAEITARLLGEP